MTILNPLGEINLLRDNSNVKRRKSIVYTATNKSVQ